MELAIRRGINGCVKRIHRFNKLGIGDALNEWIVVRMQGAHRTKRNRDGNVNDNRLKAMPARKRADDAISTMFLYALAGSHPIKAT